MKVRARSVSFTAWAANLARGVREPPRSGRWTAVVRTIGLTGTTDGEELMLLA
jgi:hypothetical protein